MPSDRERIVALETNQLNTRRSIDQILEYMKEGREWREETSSTLAVVVNNQQGMAQYQIRCDAERENMQHDYIGLDKRTTATEGFQKRQLKYGAAITAIASTVGIGSPKLWEKISGLFS